MLNLTESLPAFALILVETLQELSSKPLKAMLSQLGCPPIKFGMYQPRFLSFLIKKPLDIQIMKRFNLFFDELLWYTKL